MLPKRNGQIWNPPLQPIHKSLHEFCRGRHPWRPVCSAQCYKRHKNRLKREEIKIKQIFFKKGLQNAAVCVIIIDGDKGV